MVTPGPPLAGAGIGPRSGGSWLVAAALGAIAAGVVWVTLDLRVPAGISLNYGEGFVQLDALRAARGEALYSDPARIPWTLQVYTPLYPWLVSWAARLGADGYAAGRLLGYAAVLATALLVGLAGQRRTGAAAWCVAAFYLTLPLFVSWGAAVRPDNLAVLCATAGVVVVDRCTGSRRVLAAVPLFLAAGLAKQSSVAAPLAAALWLALQDPRRALGFSVLLAAGAALCLAALQAGSDGWFWLHAYTSHAAKPFAWERAWHVLGSFLRFHAPLALFAAGLLGWLLLRRRTSCAVLWLALATLATASAGKSGSDTNYFLEPAAALALVAARELPLPLAPHAGLVRRAAATLAAAAALVFAVLNLRIHRENAAWIPAAEARFEVAAASWAQSPGPVIADDAGFLLQTGHALLWRPFIMTQLAAAGLWDERPLVEALEAGEVALVVVQRQPEEIFRSRYGPALRRALARRYERVDAYRTDFEYEIHAPRARAREAFAPER